MTHYKVIGRNFGCRGRAIDEIKEDGVNLNAAFDKFNEIVESKEYEFAYVLDEDGFTVKYSW